LSERIRSASVGSSTARNHVQNILDKLVVQNKAQAVSYAYKSGLL
jgi:DNA-binding CsgD family transcriptional regulator